MHEGTRYGPQTHPQFDVREPDAYLWQALSLVRRLDAPTMDGKIKAPPPVGRMWLVGLEFYDV